MAEDRAARMEALRQEIRALEESPLYDFRQEHNYKPVIGEGSLNAKIMFIGEAPGASEAKTGRPFVGAAGRVLDSLLESIGLDREKVYITNVVKDRPPENRDPLTAEIEIYSPFLSRQIEIIQPEVVATLGRFAMDFILEFFSMEEQQGKKISELHGKQLEATTDYGEVYVVPLYHPAVALYNRDQRDTLEEDFKVLERFK